MKVLFTQGTVGVEHGKRSILNGASVFQVDWSFGKGMKKAEPTMSPITSSAIAPFLAGVGLSFVGYFIAVITNKKEVK